MDFGRVFEISASGLEAQRIRMNAIASNLANAQSTRSDEGGPYRRKDVIFESKPAGFGDVFQTSLDSGTAGVSVSGVIEDQRPFKVVFDPQHPDANEKGYVELPNVNLLEEMVNMMSASRSYEANVTALNTTKTMVNKALEIGR
jgi:flagellar basal-body rod protein FlgC